VSRRGADLAWLAGELSSIRRELLPPGDPTALFLALDQGGSASRAVLFDAAGREVAAAHVPISTRREGADRVEHDAEELVRSLAVAAQDVCEAETARGRPGYAWAGLLLFWEFDNPTYSDYDARCSE